MDNDLSQHLISSISDVIIKDALLDEYDFIPDILTEVNVNPIIVEEHKLAIRSWAVPVAYSYAYLKIFSQTLISSDESNKLSLVVLLVNPNCSTVWNLRKKMINVGTVSMDDENRFTRLVLRKHPKCADIFSHRKWLVTNRLAELQRRDARVEDAQRGVDGGGERELLIRQELDASLMAANKYASNYSAWSHRIWCLQQLGPFISSTLINEELDVSARFTDSHVSDHSGWHYRQFIVNLACDVLHNRDAKTCVSVLQQELINNTQLIDLYTGHEALWYTRRAIVTMLLKWTSTCTASPRHDTHAIETKHACLDFQQPVAAAASYGAGGGNGVVVDGEVTFADCVVTHVLADNWQSTLATMYKRWLLRHLVSTQ